MERDYKYSYRISPERDKKAFKKACKTIETKLKRVKKEKLLMDVDSTLIQIYYYENEEIIVYDDYVVDAVYIKSNYPLEDVLGLQSI